MKKNILLFIVTGILLLMLVACGGSSSDDDAQQMESEDSSVDENSSDSENQSDASNDSAGSISQFKSSIVDRGLEGQEVNPVVDGKYVSKSYMLTTLTNADVNISETQDMLTMSTPSENALIFVNLFPGLQNYGATADFIQSLIPTKFENGQAKAVVDGYLFGYRAKLIPFTCTYNGVPIQAIYAVTVVNQSMYTVVYMYSANVSDSEIALMNTVVSSMQILKPEVVDKTTKKAAYVDPYETVTVYYYPEIYFPDYYENYDDYYYYDISAWDYMPYDCYEWCEIDYSAYDVSMFMPDYDYYEYEEQYWDWGWDEEYDWAFYEAYEEVYAYETYDAYEDYSVDFEYDDSSFYEVEETYYEEEYFESYDE